jgi:hypothetical protein
VSNELQGGSQIEGRIANSLNESPRNLTTPSCFVRPLVEVGCHVGQNARHTLERRRVNRIEKISPNTREMNGPRGLHLGHAPRGNPRDVPTRISGTRRLGHKTAHLELIHQPRRPACRQARSAGEIRHPQLAIGRFGEMHDRRILARRQTCALNEITVKQPRNDLHNAHYGAPQLLFARREWVNCHTIKRNLLGQANYSLESRES